MAFSNLEKAMGAIIGIDLLAPGTTRAVARTLVGAAARASPVAARSVGLTNPYGLGLGLGIGALQTAPGQALLEAAEERGRADRLRLERFVQDTLATAEFKTKRAVKRKKSAFNNAVSAGMKAVKGSTSYGKKGTISNARKAFSAVTKVVSGIRKGRRAPTSGIRRKIFNAAKPKMIVDPTKIKLGTGKGR